MSCSLLGYSQSAFYNLGKSYAEEGNYDDAIRLTKQSLDLNTQNTDICNVFFDNLALSEYYSYINQPDSCKAYADKAIKLWHNHGNVL